VPVHQPLQDRHRGLRLVGAEQRAGQVVVLGVTNIGDQLREIRLPIFGCGHIPR